MAANDHFVFAGNKNANTALQERFQALNCSWDAFCSLEYVGTRTHKPPTDFLGLLCAIEAQLRNTTVRSARKPHVIFKVLEVRSAHRYINNSLQYSYFCQFGNNLIQ